ncbi:MAG: DUF1501 domain-containing protein [Ilumatobacteraceae bacterium]
MPISRRHFVRVLSATGAAAALAGLDRSAQALAGQWSAAAGPSTPGTLVLVTLSGGNDALNTVAPIDDPRYRAARGALALDPTTAHPLGDGFALHPSLTGLKGLWDAQRLAVVRGVGFPGLDRSHFHCMDVWQAGDEDDHTTGWLGRWLDAVGTTPLDAIAVGRDLPLALRGATRSAAVVPVGPFELPGDASLRRAFTTLCAAETRRPPLHALVASTMADLLAVVDQVGPIGAGIGSADELLDEGDDDQAGGADGAPTGGGRASGLAGQFEVVARGIEAGLPARVWSVSLGGFDTHANQAPTHEALLAELDGAVSAFVTRMGLRPVTVAVYSEFGRRVTSNGSAGTDHGTAGTMLLAGTVQPGFHGDPPPFDQLHDGDLVTTVDFRSVYGGVLQGVLGMDAADVFPDGPAPLAVV